MLLPTVRRTWAPRGATPLLRHRYRRDQVSAISAVTVNPRPTAASSTPPSTATRSPRSRWRCSCGCCSDTWPASSSCSGTGARFTGDRRSRKSWPAFPASSAKRFSGVRAGTQPRGAGVEHLKGQQRESRHGERPARRPHAGHAAAAPGLPPCCGRSSSAPNYHPLFHPGDSIPYATVNLVRTRRGTRRRRRR